VHALRRLDGESCSPVTERFVRDLFSPAIAVTSNRLRLLHLAQYGLVRQRDEEGTYCGGPGLTRAQQKSSNGHRKRTSPNARND